MAIKIGLKHDNIEHDFKMLSILKGFKNPAVEKEGIVTIYHKGKLRKKYSFIAMTLCGESMFDIYMRYGRYLPENILRIYYQLVSTAFLNLWLFIRFY